MSADQRYPAADKWFAEPAFDARRALLMSVDQLSSLQLTAEGNSPPEFPADVLSQWRQLLNRKRLTIAQSEAALIRTARSQGWTWTRIETELGCPNGKTRLAELEREVAERHPRQRPELYEP